MERRPLSLLELPYAVTNTVSGASLVVRGTIDLPLFSETVGALLREYPALAGRLEPGPFGFDLVAGEPPDPLPILIENRAFEPGDVRLDVRPEVVTSGFAIASDGDLHRVSVGANHAVADAGSGLFLSLRLWELYTTLVTTGSLPPVEPQPLPSSPQEVAARLGLTGVAPAPRPTGVRSVGVPPTVADLDADGFGFTRIRLDADETDAVHRRARSAGLSLHALIAGVITLAERAELSDVADDDPVRIAVFSPVDLRFRYDPPVPPASVTNFAGASTAVVTVRVGDAPEDIGRVVIDRLRADLADGTAAADLSGTSDTTAQADAGPAGVPIRISNIGEVPAPVLPPGLVAEDFYTSSEVGIDRVRLLIRAMPPEALEALVGLHYHALSFGGRLSIEMRYAPGTVSADTAARLRDRIVAGLRSYAVSHSA